MAIISSRSLCRKYSNSPGVEFLRAFSKLGKRKKISSLYVYVLYKTEIRHIHVIVVQKRQRNLSPSSDLKVPDDIKRTLKILSSLGNICFNATS